MAPAIDRSLTWGSKLVLRLTLTVIFSAPASWQLPTDAQNGSTTDLIARQAQQEGTRYAVVIDCGSSGSRAHIFQWPSSVATDQLASRIEPMRDPKTGLQLTKRIRPGLASVRDQPEAASDYMRPLMEFISEHIPEEAQRETPVYFMGTAGLRLLSRKEQEQILDDIARDLRIEFRFQNLVTEVITGSEEGLYQWLSVNAYFNRLNPFYEQSGRDFYCTSPCGRRFGMLEIGGASAQVAFELTPELDRMIERSLKHNQEALEAYEASKATFRLGPHRSFELFSTTFLGLGSNSAREAAGDLLVRDATQSTPAGSPPSSHTPASYSLGDRTLIVEDPCLPIGSSETMEKPIELLLSRSQTIGFHLGQSGASQLSFSLRLVGAGNFAQCRHLLHRVLWLAKHERLNCGPPGSPCSIALLGTNFLPFRYLQWLGLAELYYTTNEMIKSAGQFDAAKIWRKTAQICSTPHEQLLKQFPEANRNDRKRTLLECFKATWMLTWLKLGLRTPHSHKLDLRTVDNPNDWTLGALIAKLYEND